MWSARDIKSSTQDTMSSARDVSRFLEFRESSARVRKSIARENKSSARDSKPRARDNKSNARDTTFTKKDNAIFLIYHRGEVAFLLQFIILKTLLSATKSTSSVELSALQMQNDFPTDNMLKER